MKRYAILAGVLLCFGAFADRVITVTSASAKLTEGTWERLPDAGYRFGACGNAGNAPLPEGRCSVCEPGAWNGALAVCLATWKSERGL